MNFLYILYKVPSDIKPADGKVSYRLNCISEYLIIEAAKATCKAAFPGSSFNKAYW